MLLKKKKKNRQKRKMNIMYASLFLVYWICWRFDQRKTNLAKTPSLGSSPRHEALNSFYLKRLTLVGSPL